LPTKTIRNEVFSTKIGENGSEYDW